ncbi:MAG: hypothetical protein ILP11_00785 [Alphaproteobacteria bacterium]|nr:hypothetical protein [Alphaproteobacteria bacterium]
MSTSSFVEMVKRWVWRPYETSLPDGATRGWFMTAYEQAGQEVARAYRKGLSARRKHSKSMDRARQYAKTLLAEAYQQPQTIERHKQIANILRYYHAQKKARQRL